MIQLIVMTDEEFRRQGIGRQTLKGLDAKARDLDLDYVGLHVFAYNEAAIKPYETAGFATTSMNMSKKLS